MNMVLLVREVALSEQGGDLIAITKLNPLPSVSIQLLVNLEWATSAV